MLSLEQDWFDYSHTVTNLILISEGKNYDIPANICAEQRLIYGCHNCINCTSEERNILVHAYKYIRRMA